MSKYNKIPVMCLGVGTVGQEVIQQLLTVGDTVAHRTGWSLVPIALANSLGALVSPHGFSEKRLRSVLKLISNPTRWESQPEYRPLPALRSLFKEGVMVIDATASTEIRPFLLESLQAGCGVVLANKNPLTVPWKKARGLFEHPDVRYECTVGAGLPVIETLLGLLAAGDEVSAIEGSLSGTLGYLCAEMERGRAFSDALLRAGEEGYTEPDPREDLSGRDVTRKVLILARTAGWPHGMEELTAEPLFPDSLSGLPVEDFLDKAEELDGDYGSMFEATQKEGKTWRYMAKITPQGGRVGLTSVKRSSPLGALQGPANYVAFYTRQYRDIPLVISGPGAGAAVTAAGVVRDVISLAKSMKDPWGRGETG